MTYVIRDTMTCGYLTYWEAFDPATGRGKGRLPDQDASARYERPILGALREARFYPTREDALHDIVRAFRRGRVTGLEPMLVA